MYIADLHVHSRYSRATSRDCTPEFLDLWARRKGICLIGTGDFTHPAWRQELCEKLRPAEDGLYVLKEEYRMEDGLSDDSIVPRFVVTGEISSIYKKAEKTRKVHSLLVLPGLTEAENLSNKLEALGGNLHSDGRPILGMDCKNLLELLLDTSPEGMYIPAHIWTPHFSLFGAFSGFDRMEDCFEDLTPCIHALETGLSSDPPMNWKISALDGCQLVSHSDAHSPAKLGREADLLNTELSYQGLFGAIQKGEGLAGTLEFFPEEGKYFYDGHRKCGICMTPEEAERCQNRCPVCGKKLTFGVAHRVESLSDREDGNLRPDKRYFEKIVPLEELLAAVQGFAAPGKKTKRLYAQLLQTFGSEFAVLREVPEEDIRKLAGSLASDCIGQMRKGKLIWQPGFDGEYGRMEIKKDEEIL